MTIQPVFGGPRVTAIGSGKGGTGKTVATLALAELLVREGEKVLVCDADLGLSNTSVHLGLEHGGDLAGFLAGKRALKDAVTKVAGGFDLLAAPAGSGALANPRGETLARLVAGLRGARQYDRILLDLAAGVDETVLHLAAKADESLLVMTPDPASLTDGYAFAKLLHRRTAPLPSIVVNMATSEQEARRTAEALINAARAFLDCVPDYLGGIPRDPHVQDAVRRQSALYALHPHCHAIAGFLQVSRKLHRRIPASADAVNVR